MGLTQYYGTYTVIGPPGTGKTTWVKSQVQKIVSDAGMIRRRPPVLLCSLTKAASHELAGRVKDIRKSQVGTLHSHAKALLKAEKPFSDPEIMEAFNSDYPVFAMTPEKKEESLAGERNPKRHGDDLNAQYHLFRARMVPRESWPTHVQGFATAIENWKRAHGAMDFSDWIEVARDEFPKHPDDPEVIIADEAQDMSALEFSLLKRWAENAQAMIIVGDPWQALYVWRGAHPEIFAETPVGGDHARVLKRSWRVPLNVQKWAVDWISKRLSTYDPAIEYFPKDGPDGKVEHSPATYKNVEPLLGLIENRLAVNSTVMIQASCGYMIEPMISILRKAGIPFANPWSDSNGRWNPLRNATGSTMGRLLSWFKPAGIYGEPKPWLVRDLVLFTELLSAKACLNHGAKAYVKTLADDEEAHDGFLAEADIKQVFNPDAAAAVMAAIHGGIAYKHMRTLLDKWVLDTKVKAMMYPLSVIESREPEQQGAMPGCYVGTIHSFKGAEADTVIVFPDISMMAHQYAVQYREGKDALARLFYVAATRSKHELILCNQATPWAVRW
jgi:superfamily I DNA/RNA helicase